MTRDGLRISAAHLPMVEAATVKGQVAARSTAIVVVHGFGGSWRQERVLRVMEHLGEHAGVIGIDQRGHGDSEGATTLAHDEPLDVEAATRWARDLGYARVVTVGFSMGGAVVLRHAALLPRGPAGNAGTDAVVSVSAPAFWFYRGTPPMRWLHRAVFSSLGRGYLRAAMGARVDPTRWPDPPPLQPVAAAERVATAGMPILIVHGDRDAFFPLEHAEALGSPPGVECWIEPGFGHAEGAISVDLIRRIGAWTVARGPA
jgi:pimeloyl-ACP methyl ester carboxylesterase